MTPYFLLSSLKDPLFSLFSLSPKDPYFGGRVRTYPSLSYVSAPPGFLSNARWFYGKNTKLGREICI